MQFGRTNVNKFLIEEQRRNPALAGDFSMLISDVVRSCKAISQVISRGALAGFADDPWSPNPHDDELASPAHLANQAFLNHCVWGGHLTALTSSEAADISPIPNEGARGKYLLVFDPLDGAQNIDVNVTVGSIFSVLACRDDVSEPTAADFLQPGSRQLAAGYALYGPSTMLVLTVGNGTHGFTLDREIGEFLLTHPGMRIPPETSSFAINTSNGRFWEPPIRRYVDECMEGRTGIRAKDFNMRWVASMVGDVHRILTRGGVFMYPRDNREPEKPGKLRLMYEANPMSLIVEQAGGAATDGLQRILDIQPEQLHQRVAVFLGSREEVERVTAYHQ